MTVMGYERNTSASEAAQERPTTESGARIPDATYRLQFNGQFTFRDATALLAYLHDLGISDIYASPILRARRGSLHGYDVCDPTQLNPALGSEQDFEDLVGGLKERKMGLLLDTVPNHMGIDDTCNIWWMDVLENGPSSPYATFFDIDWHPIKPEFQNKVLLPVLEDQYGTVLESGKLRLEYADSGFTISYHDLRLPVAPGTYRIILAHWLEKLSPESPSASPVDGEPAAAITAAPTMAEMAAGSDTTLELQSILTAVNHLPSRTETDTQRVLERYREKEVIKRRLAALCNTSPEAEATLSETLADFNGRPGDPHSFDLLDALMDVQVYRLAFWRVAGEEINYRRFFDINDLAAVRVELPEVFQATHQLTLRLLSEGKATGLRIDHPDGMWDPPTYFRRLQESYRQVIGGETGSALAETPEAGEQNGGSRDLLQAANQEPPQGGYPAGTQAQLPLYVIAEKILSEREPLPQSWAVFGTTGYDFLTAVNGLMVQIANRQAFDRIYTDFINHPISLDDLTISTRMMIMRESLASEINSLSHQLERIGERNRHYRDFTLNGISAALREVIACLPVYRTYINALAQEVPEQDRRFVEMAVRTARWRRPGLPDPIFDFIRDTLLLRNLDDFAEQDQAELVNFVMKFQQLTGPVMAKGVEDTAFYIYNRLVSLNEVGSSPEVFGISVANFHRDNHRRAERWPHTLLATSTHDSKHSEDVRARINVLSEIPEVWGQAISGWSRLNSSQKAMAKGKSVPDLNDEYLLYQTLLGTWPLATSDPPEREPQGADEAGRWSFLLTPSANDPEFADFRQRIVLYMQKAAREAKVHTSWVNPDAEYDGALQSFVEHVLDPDHNRQFLNEFAELARPVAYYGQFNALSQILLKFTVPGVPDIYQGQELWNFSLVDPDNRRPVDYELRRRLMAELRAQIQRAPAGAWLEVTAELLRNSHDGRIKLFVSALALEFRRAHRDLFAQGSYQPFLAQGAKADHVCAFAREYGGQKAIAIAPRLIAGLTGQVERPPLGSSVWSDTWLALPRDQPGTPYHSVFTRETFTVSEHDNQPGLPLALVLARFPVALLSRAEIER